MAEPFNWPPEESEVQALDLEHNSTSSAPDNALPSGSGPEAFPAGPAASSFSGPDLAALEALERRLRGGKPVRPVGDQFDVTDHQRSRHGDLRSEESPGAANRHNQGSATHSVAARQPKNDPTHSRAGSTAERRWGPLSGRGFTAHAAGIAIARRFTGALGSDWRRIANRWALLALAVVVVIESVLLAIGGFRIWFEQPPQTDPSADRQAIAVTSPERNTDSPADIVTWQAAQAENAAAVGGAATTRPPAAAPGSVSISLPFQVEVYEGDRFIGLNAGAGIRLSPGPHRLTLVNESLSYRATQTVNISSGQTTAVTAPLSTGMLQLNASPWAEVVMDGKSLGETPLGNVSVPIGPHTLVFRHPELGEQSRSVVVIAQSSTRVTVDLEKK
jgi:hypothetical protein